MSKQFVVLAAAHFIALLSPGPDFFLLVGNCARRGLASGLGTAAGIAVANAVYIASVIAGFGFLHGNHLLSLGIRTAGVVYLAYVSWMLIRSGWAGRGSASNPAKTEPAGAGTGFRMGLLSGLLNPKNGLFYLGLFSASISTETPVGMRIGYGLWLFGVVLAWDAGLAYLFSRGLGLKTLQRHLPTVELLSGIALGCLAFGLVLQALPLPN